MPLFKIPEDKLIEFARTWPKEQFDALYELKLMGNVRAEEPAPPPRKQKGQQRQARDELARQYGPWVRPIIDGAAGPIDQATIRAKVREEPRFASNSDEEIDRGVRASLTKNKWRYVESPKGTWWSAEAWKNRGPKAVPPSDDQAVA